MAERSRALASSPSKKRGGENIPTNGHLFMISAASISHDLVSYGLILPMLPRSQSFSCKVSLGLSKGEDKLPDNGEIFKVFKRFISVTRLTLLKIDNFFKCVLAAYGDRVHWDDLRCKDVYAQKNKR